MDKPTKQDLMLMGLGVLPGLIILPIVAVFMAAFS